MPTLPFTKKNGKDHLDQKLIRQTQNRSLPSFSQMKYFFRFLSGSEKRFFFISVIVCLLGLAALTTTFASKHLTRVPSEGGEYSEALLGQPKYINPLFASASDVDADLSSLVYSGMFRYSDGKLVPDLATGYTVSTDSLKYKISLRHDVKFADGEPFTASDVIYTIDLIQNPEVASPLFSAFQGVTAQKIDDYDLELTLKTPFAPFINSLSVGILPEHVWGETNPSGLKLAKNNLQPIGTGPWQFNKLIKDSSGRIDSLTLTKNNNYYGQKPFFKTLRFKFFDEYTSAAEAIKSQSVDTLSFYPHVSNLKISGNYLSTYQVRLPEYTALFFNSSNQLLKNDDLRSALKLATDKNEIVTRALGGNGVSIDSPFLPGMIGYTDHSSEFSIDKANALLDKKWTRIEPEEYFKTRHDDLIKQLRSGATSTTSTVVDAETEKQISDQVRSEMDPGQPFYRKDKNNNILELTITTGSNEEYVAVAKMIATSWEKIGVRTLIETADTNRLIRETVKNRDFDVLLYSEILGTDPDPYPFWHSSQSSYPGLNLSGFNDKDADKLLEDARATTDENVRAGLYQKFDTALIKEIPAIFLYSPLHSIAINKEVKGVNFGYISTPADRFENLSNWFIKTKFKWN